MIYIDKHNQVLDDPTASYWLKSALRALECRDPHDAACDAEKLHELTEQRRKEALVGFSPNWRITGGEA